MSPGAALLTLALSLDPVNLRAGEVAPFDGALVDQATATQVWTARRACELERDGLRTQLEDAQSRPEWGGVVVAVLVAAALGLAGGVYVGASVSR